MSRRTRETRLAHVVNRELVRQVREGLIEMTTTGLDDDIECERGIVRALLAVLHPTVPNTVEALDKLPVGTVIRIDTRAYVHTAAWEWVETVTGTAYTADELDTEAVIIYRPKEGR